MQDRIAIQLGSRGLSCQERCTLNEAFESSQHSFDREQLANRSNVPTKAIQASKSTRKLPKPIASFSEHNDPLPEFTNYTNETDLSRLFCQLNLYFREINATKRMPFRGIQLVKLETYADPLL